MFVKILVFVKILSQWRRKEERKDKKFRSLEVREASSSHIKTKTENTKIILIFSQYLDRPVDFSPIYCSKIEILVCFDFEKTKTNDQNSARILSLFLTKNWTKIKLLSCLSND